MWNLDTHWFDVAIIMTVFAIGNIMFGHFEMHRPVWRRLLKVALVTAVYLALATYPGRVWSYGMLVVFGVGAVVIHGWWLPKNGINGWTGQPRDKYLELVASKKQTAQAE